MLQVGKRAPDLDAVASDGSTVRLLEPGARCWIVYFFHRAFAPPSARQAAGFRDNHTEIVLGGARIVGVSTDDVATQRRFAEALRIPFPLVADTDRVITGAFGALFPFVGVSRRVTFAIGADRRIDAVFDHEVNIQKHRDEVLRYVDAKVRADRPAQTRTLLVPPAPASGPELRASWADPRSSSPDLSDVRDSVAGARPHGAAPPPPRAALSTLLSVGVSPPPAPPAARRLPPPPPPRGPRCRRCPTAPRRAGRRSCPRIRRRTPARCP